MHSLLEARHYVSPDVFDLEQRRIFRKLWIFAGVRTLLASPDSFITRIIGGIPVVIQNCGGRLRAFINQCAHRQGALQIGDHGQRRLACRYHGWVYHDDGSVKSIPSSDTLYGFDDACKRERQLTAVALECVGNIMFVNLDPTPRTLESQFHREFLSRLECVSAFIDDEVLLSQFECNFNWKLTFENVVDFNHVAYVHASTFAPLLPELRSSPARSTNRVAPPVGDAEVGDDIRDLSYASEVPMELRHWPWHDNVERFTPESKYFNFYVYPNVNFLSLAGVIFTIQQFNPLAPARTHYMLWVATGRKKTPNPATPAILWSQVRGEKSVIDEDIVVLQALQNGLSVDGPRAFHGAYEQRLRSIGKVYTNLLAAGGN